MKMKDYEILSRDIVVAVWNENSLEIKNEQLLPLFLKRTANADAWLESRVIDSHRANSRLLKKALRMSEKDDISTVKKANAVTITDTYWIRPLGSSEKYENVRFDEKYFEKLSAKAAANMALKGSYSSFNYVAGHSSDSTAELTNIGSFEKCWKMLDGKWWMFKAGSEYEIFTEIFVSRLCGYLGIDAAIYERGEKCVKTKDFTDGAKLCFEPAVAFMGDNEDYEDTIEKLNVICPQAIPAYIKMIFLDALIANPDRHTGNFGLLRNPDDGALVGFAPCFDHNMALISKGYNIKLGRNDLLIRLFKEVCDKHPEYKNFIPEVTEDKIRAAIADTGMRARKEFIVKYLLDRAEMIKR